MIESVSEAILEPRPVHAAQAAKPVHAAKCVLEATAANVRSFLYELAEGTTLYRTVHSLTEQVEHQYSGRFLVELVQNAHDQLDAVFPEAESRIATTLTDEGDYGVLYVANDGRPFSPSNFKSLSNLGQSDKNPEASIGHKGIGFRSVLEITDSPEVYSRATPDSARFDGFCLYFSPSVVRGLLAPIAALVEGDDTAVLPYSEMPIVDWDPKGIAKLRTSVRNRAAAAGVAVERWLRQEVSFLSPYSLPLPIRGGDRGEQVVELARQGYATVIRLPLKSAVARAAVLEKLKEIQGGDILFLQRSSQFAIDTGEWKKVFRRKQLPSRTPNHWVSDVVISNDTQGEARRYWIWQRELTIQDAPQTVQEAVRDLPGKWPEIRHVTVSLGVPVVEAPERGRISIFLPTPLETGCSVHFNAPFFGDMSRTHVDFDEGDAAVSAPSTVYNRYLLRNLADLALAVIEAELAGHGADEARAIVDLLAPHGVHVEAVERWQELVQEAARSRHINVKEAPWCLADLGWRSLAETSLLPVNDGARVLSDEILRKHATFPTYVAALSSRRQWLERLSTAHNVPVAPAPKDLADTIEGIANELHGTPNANWDAFWSETFAILDGDAGPLQGKRVLLGTDGELHASGGECAIFFVPRQGTGDDDELSNESDVRNVPEALKPYVAFLSDRIQQYEEKSSRLVQTPTRKHLEDADLVVRFRREDIFSDVLLPRTPQLPAPLVGPAARICQDITTWGLRLAADLSEKGKGERLLPLVRRLPVPCRGGWYLLGTAAFGPGWTGTKGGVAYDYLSRVDTPETQVAKARLLLPPDHELWGGAGDSYLPLLKQAGVLDGLLLLEPEEGPWSTGFEAFRGYFQLPEKGPSGWASDDWAQYRDVVRSEARPAYNKGRYEVSSLRVLPGLDQYASFDEDTRTAFMHAVFASAGQWPRKWWKTTVTKAGGNPDSFDISSPIAWKLRQLVWIRIKSGDQESWRGPSECWHVPATEMAGNRAGQFVHLRPLSAGLANLLDRDPALAESMRQLGMPRFDLESRSPDARLLEALVHAVEAGTVRNWDILLGQVRGAWGSFEAPADNRLPAKLLVHDVSGHLAVQTPDSNTPCYLPDTRKAFVGELKRFNRPVVAIEPADAGRLAESFVAAYGQGIVRASTLDSAPLVHGTRWTESAEGYLKHHERLDWLVPVVLTVVANHGPEAPGVGAKSFQRYVTSMQNARVAICDSVQLALYESEQVVGEPIPMPALWHEASRTLLLRNPDDSDAAEVSEALASLLERDDMEVPLRLVLRITGWDPAPAAIARGLAELKLDESHLRTVREHLIGDLRQVIANLCPMLSILRQDADIGRLLGCDTEEAVVAFVNDLADERLNGHELVAMSRMAGESFEFGLKAWECFGNKLQLDRWNVALVNLGWAPIKNKEAHAEFRTHLNSATPVLRSLVATLLAAHPELGEFDQLLSRMPKVECPTTWSTAVWCVGFDAAVSELVRLFREWHASDGAIHALQQAKTVEELRNLVGSLGIDTDRDPTAIARDNREKLRAALARLQTLGLAWALAYKTPNPVDWENCVDGYVEVLRAETNPTVLTSVWTESDVWGFIQRIPTDEIATEFWKAFQEANGFDDLAAKLGLSPEAIDGAREKLQARREEAHRRNRIVAVCGREFENSDDNLNSLWSHIEKALPDSVLGSFAPVDLGHVAELAELKKADGHGKGGKRGDGGHPKKGPHLSKSMEQLVGLTGEIHAYRMLLQHYGPGVVHAGCWRASNSARAGLNLLDQTDDGLGCDFVVVHQGQTHYIEVKSSVADDDRFTLGSSEIRLAKELLQRPRRRRKEKFQVLCVSNTLTERPSFRLLPNPYDPRFESLFDIDPAEARVRYRSKE